MGSCVIPGGNFTETPLIGGFLSPLNKQYLPLHFKTTGGNALGDGVGGRLLRNWIASWQAENISIYPEGGEVALTIQAPGATSVCIAFNENMGIYVAWVDEQGAKLYLYDEIIKSYKTISYPGVTSCRLCVDDMRDFYESDSDVMLAYTKSGNLYYRQQRENFELERFVGATQKKLKRFGLSNKNRLQFELI